MARDIEQTIANLLAKAEGTTNPAEAEAYMAKAEKLMVQHGVERAQLEAKRPGTKQQVNIVTERVYIPNGHGYAMALVRIAFNLGDAFSVRVLQSTDSKGGKHAWFIGHSTDVDDAKLLFNSLVAQAVPQAKAWWKAEGKVSRPWATDNDAYLARREFIFAFASGVGDRLRETRKVVVEEAGAGAELVLVDRVAQVDAWVTQNIEVGKGRASNRQSGGYDATIAGREAGRNAVGSKALS